ncbi:hypothetical protein BDN70DRAFT_876021 [Pholiota conissans]|uniref:Uncharacterized protein n=1 Tax=Pholiota conissans TaxID=109636 RepID=A0A9P6CWC4_9AGAR|nr:hypothetical protein BDN70DRAFT_876021 [Pholiota conissans]
MAPERNISRPWSEEEDQQLREAVALFGENDNWKSVASLVQGRTNKACRKRWLHSLQPNVKKSAWTSDEDQLLTELYEQFGPKWSAIARQIDGRTDDACSKRYREALDPNLKKDQWTPEEDQHLLDVYNRIGGKWGKVGYELQRSGLGCRNRWRLLERKRAQRTSQFSSPEQVIQSQEHLAPVVDYTTPIEIPSVEIPPTEPQWPPYFPPEAYPTFPTDEDNTICIFREPTPETLHIQDPTNVAPFQPSSSSLSAALSDPPPPPRPLPPISLNNTPELLVQDIPNDSERQPSLSPLSQCNGIPEMNDILMSQPSYPQPMQQMDTTHLETSITHLPYDDTFSLSRLHDSSFFTSASPIYIPTELPRTLDPLQFSFWKPRSAPETDFENSPRSTIDNRSVLNEDFSSAASTPFGLFTPLSPASSPFTGQIMELPSLDQPSSTSLLFSPSNDSQSSLLQRTKKLSVRKPKPTMKTSTTTRLSSVLPLDPNLRPYACGYTTCWLAGAKSSLSCFSTSGELLDHTKDAHAESEVAEKPYRCALPGCDKSWKSINGLQYHLQISTAHFTNALFSRFSQQQPATPEQSTSPLSGDDGEGEPERKHMCPLPGCYKAYRQTSGLRYHKKFGHPTEMPAQLEVVPPALERVIPLKAKKLRVKATESVQT